MKNTKTELLVYLANMRHEAYKMFCKKSFKFNFEDYQNAQAEANRLMDILYKDHYEEVNL